MNLPPPATPSTAAAAGNPWPGAAKALAQRVGRRLSLEAGLSAAGPWFAVGAASAVAVRLFGGAAGPAAAALVGGGTLGLLRGFLAARASTRPQAADAAWALDRVGSLGERGLAAATGALRDAAAIPALPRLPRLRPPRGAALVVAAAVLGTLALLAPPAKTAADAEPARAPAGAAEREHPSSPRSNGDPSGSTVDQPTGDGEAAGPLGAGRGPLERLREPLNLPPDAPLDLTDLTERLADPASRDRAAAALAGDAMADLLARGDTAPAAAAAAVLEAQRRWVEAEERSRRAASSQDADGAAFVPPSRRALVARFLDRLNR